MSKPHDPFLTPDQEPARPSPARVDEPEDGATPPEAGTDEARNEQRKTQPSRNRGVTDV